METQFVCIDITSIEINPNNPRKVFDSIALGELSASIKEKGVLQPITVRPIGRTETGEAYQLVCGERRWRAASMAGLREIPAIIRDLTDEEAMDVAITENLQRKDVSPLEEADAFKYLLDKGKTVADLCGRFGKSEFYVRNRLKLLSMNDDFRRLLDDGTISISQAMEIVKFDEEVQAKMYKDHFVENWQSWRDLTARSIYNRAMESYARELSTYNFDKTECEACARCTKNSTLFGAVSEASCLDLECLGRKLMAHKVESAITLQRKHPEASFVTWNKESAMKNTMEELGHEVSIANGYVSRVGAVVGKELRDRITRGEVQLVINVENDPFLGYIETGSAGVVSAGASAIKSLQDKDKRNKEIAEENTVSEVRGAIQKMDVAAMSKGNLSEYEMQLMLFTIVKNLTKEQQEKIGTVKSYYISDEEAWDIVQNATPEQIAYIHRCNILNKVGDHTRKDFKTELFFKWVTDRDESIIPAAEQKFHEIYLKRHEKIEARIAKIEMEEK